MEWILVVAVVVVWHRRWATAVGSFDELDASVLSSTMATRIG